MGSPESEVERGEDETQHPFRVAITWREAGSVSIIPEGGLDPDTSYVMGFPRCLLQPHMVCAPPIKFSTASAPRVLAPSR